MNTQKRGVANDATPQKTCKRLLVIATGACPELDSGSRNPIGNTYYTFTVFGDLLN